MIKKYLPEIVKIETKNVFCDSPEVLGALKKYQWDSFCYRFAGLNNPVEVSRYPYLRFLGGWFHRYMLTNLTKLNPDALLAAADLETTRRFERENKRFLKGLTITSFPTRFDPNVFYPSDGQVERRELGWEENYPRLLVTGRLSWLKGWELALEALTFLKKLFPKPKLVFVGDGEDRIKLEKRVEELGIQNETTIEGFLPPSELRRRLVASDLYLITSLREGWSVASTEALACGKRIVATDLKADLSNLWQAYQNNIEMLKLERENLIAAVENHEIASERYMLGNLSGIEMREAQKSLLDAEERILSAEYDTKMCEISLLQLSGKITKYLE
ncbi:MAG: glycosyltransferase [Thermoguttaceae bacterium]|nr:glycosyltransferase [Thermoguttaceae bacterium]